MGHPLGASGAQLANTAINRLHHSVGCWAVHHVHWRGQSIAVVLVRIQQESSAGGEDRLHTGPRACHSGEEPSWWPEIQFALLSALAHL